MYLNNIFNTAGRVEKFLDGQIMLKSRINLNIAKLDRKMKEANDIQKDKRDVLSVKPVGAEVINQLAINSEAAGELYSTRPSTNATATGTLYGVPTEVICESREHSYFGMNKKYLTTDGSPNELAILRRLREVSISIEAKEQRIGELYNSLFCNDFYDNSVALLAKMHMRMQLLKIIERMATHRHELQVSYELAQNIHECEDVLGKVELLKQSLNHNIYGIGFYELDKNLFKIVTDVENWFTSLPPKYVDGPVGKIKNKGFTEKPCSIKVDVWHMYHYDDGHSVSGKTFGTEFGFKNGKYMVPHQINKTGLREKNNLNRYMANWFTNEATMGLFKNAAGFVNMSGMSDDDIVLFNHFLNDNDRMTPFLCDLPFKFGLKGKVECITTRPIEIRQVQYNSQDIARLIAIYVSNHRLHEEYNSAIISTRYLIAQPATETLESHWWTTLSKTLYLPKLGLKRAALHFMLTDEGVCTSKEAIDNTNCVKTNDDTYILESLFVNTCWYWGEFMCKYNKYNFSEIKRALRDDMLPLMDESTRADVLTSALIGRPVSKPVHNSCACVLTEPLSQSYVKVVHFGKIDIEHIVNYGYKMVDNKLILNTIVPPSCVALILGLNGSLMANTPYSAMFNVNTAVRKMVDYDTYDALNYNDLWAMGVICRFQGYDLTYEHPVDYNRHVSFAANDVSIAMPPIPPVDVRIPQSYGIYSIARRRNCFGTDPSFLLNYDATLYWNRSEPILLTEPSYNARPARSSSYEGVAIRSFKVVQDDIKQYTVALKAEYDMRLSFLEVTTIEAGIPLPSRSDGSILLEGTQTEDIDQTQVPVN
uniref:Coat protein n=1 Tax=Erysiphales associated totivirus 3 TaxID=2719855 RepID=A0A6G9ELU3_9VIRU|nr:coat protein [Erysiphales associated totivirus 3]